MTTSPHGPKVSVLLPVWNAERYLARQRDQTGAFIPGRWEKR